MNKLAINSDYKESNLRYIDKNILALDALSKLAKQFSENNDHETMLNNLLYTISGQFTVNNVFVIINQSSNFETKHFYQGIGKYKNNKILSSMHLSDEFIEFLLNHNFPQKIEMLEVDSNTGNIVYRMHEANVFVICPVILNNKFLGIIGVGERVNKKECTEEDCEIFSAMVNTIAPFISNSFLFLELAGMYSWYQDVLNSVHHGVFVFDDKFNLKIINDTGFELLQKYKTKIKLKETIYNVPLEFIFSDSIFPGWVAKIKQNMQYNDKFVLENQKAGVSTLEHIYNISVNKSPRQNSSINDYIISIDDVTELKEGEQRMFELEKFADKGIMASSIAHELNNFLGMLLGGIELTNIHFKKGNQEKTNSNLIKLKDNVVKMQRFTAGLMDYTKLNTEKTKANLNEIIEDVISFVTVQKKFSGIITTSQLDPGVPDILVDSDQIAQLILNFLNNAADAIREQNPGEGKIKIETLTDTHAVYMKISDNGCGIKEEIKRKLFKYNLTTKKSGHGYGLVTCQKIINNHKAEVNIETELGNGSQFTVKIPIETES